RLLRVIRSPRPALFPYTTLFRSLREKVKLKIKKQLVTSTSLVTKGKNPGKYIAMHETDNTKPTATAQAHADLQSRGNDRDVSWRSEEHTSELQSRFDLVCRLLLE